MRTDTDTTDVYTANGYKSRADYLAELCDEYPADVVHTLADLLGPTEDFDGLVTMLEDFSETEAESDDDAAALVTAYADARAALLDARAPLDAVTRSDGYPEAEADGAEALARAAAAIARAAALAPTIRTRAAAAQQYDAGAVRTARENLTGAYLEAEAALDAARRALNATLAAVNEARDVYTAARDALNAAD